MKLKVQNLMDATLVVSQLIRDQRPMPQKGKYRLARLHTKLQPEFMLINAQRDEMIKSHGVPSEDRPGEFVVAPDKLAEFTAAWEAIASEEIEVDIEPIPFAQLDLGDAVDGGVEAGELLVLGELVVD